jgi:hypothetical protein
MFKEFGIPMFSIYTLSCLIIYKEKLILDIHGKVKKNRGFNEKTLGIKL